MFPVSQRPSAGILKTVTAACGIGHFRIVGLQAQIIYIRHFRICNLYVYFFVTSAALLFIVCFLFEDMFGDYLLLSIFVLIIFIRSCFICAIVDLFVLLKKGQIVGLKSVLSCFVLCNVFTVWNKNV
jgi:hypothetical protein